MIFDDFSKRKQDFRTKKLQFFQNIFNKKLNYDKKTRHNQSESKIISKSITKINKQTEATFEHYLKVEKELLKYIALLNTRMYPEQNVEPEMRAISDDICEMLDFIKKRRLKLMQDDKNKLEVVVYKYQKKIDNERTNDLKKRYNNDMALFAATEKIMNEIKEKLPYFKKLEIECYKLEQLNTKLRVKYETIKIEQENLYQILDNLKPNQNNKKDTLHKNNSCYFKRRIRFKLNMKNKKTPKFFISQKHSNFNKINFKKDTPINRSTSAKIKRKYSFIKMFDEKDEEFTELNKYAIKSLKELNYYTNIKYKEIEQLYTKEMNFQKKIKNLLQQCVEDLNDEYKNEQNIKSKKILEEKTFILSYLYDNCLNNGEMKSLKRQHSMFLPKK